jgi:hypothetical protein
MGRRCRPRDAEAETAEAGSHARVVGALSNFCRGCTDCNTSFLHDVLRIARRDYTPSDDDVVRARLRTLGVQEHRILFETGMSMAACIRII